MRICIFKVNQYRTHVTQLMSDAFRIFKNLRFDNNYFHGCWTLCHSGCASYLTWMELRCSCCWCYWWHVLCIVLIIFIFILIIIIITVIIINADKIFDFLPLFSHRHGNPPNILTLLYSQLVIYTFPKDGSAYTHDVSPFL